MTEVPKTSRLYGLISFYQSIEKNAKQNKNAPIKNEAKVRENARKWLIDIKKQFN